MGYALKEDEIKDLIEELRGQRSAMQLLIQTLQLKSAADIVQLLHGNAPVLESLKAKTTALSESWSMRGQRPKATGIDTFSIVSIDAKDEEESIDLSQAIFDSDRDILRTGPYARVLQAQRQEKLCMSAPYCPTGNLLDESLLEFPTEEATPGRWTAELQDLFSADGASATSPGDNTTSKGTLMGSLAGAATVPSLVSSAEIRAVLASNEKRTKSISTAIAQGQKAVVTRPTTQDLKTHNGNASIVTPVSSQPQITVKATRSSFPHAFERWETLSAHWEGLASFWIRRLEKNSDEITKDPVSQQLSRQVTDLSAAGSNLFHAVVELQRLRAASERKFQRWFFETRAEQERLQEIQALTEASLERERRERDAEVAAAMVVNRQLEETKRKLRIAVSRSRDVSNSTKS